MEHTGGSRAAAGCRGLALAWLATATSVLAHAAAGGGVPTAATTVGMVLGLSLVCAPLASRALTVRRAVILLGVLQVVVHVLSMWVSAAQHPTAPATPQLAAVLQTSGHAHLTAAASSGDMAAMDHGTQLAPGAMDLLPSLPMLGVHLAVAVLLGWALASGERAGRAARSLQLAVPSSLASITALAQRLVLRLLGAPASGATDLTAPVVVFHWQAPRLAGSLWSPQGAVRRGPPLLNA